MQTSLSKHGDCVTQQGAWRAVTKAVTADKPLCPWRKMKEGRGLCIGLVEICFHRLAVFARTGSIPLFKLNSSDATF